MSPSGVSWVCCWSKAELSELILTLICPSLVCCFKQASKAESTKRASMLQARRIFSNPFLEFCLLTAFSSITLFYMFVHAFYTLKIPVHRSGTRDTLKKVIADFGKHFICCYTIFTWIWTCTTHDLADHQLIVGSYPLANPSMERPKLCWRWSQFTQKAIVSFVPFKLPSCEFFKIFRWFVQIRLLMRWLKLLMSIVSAWF